MKKILFGSKKNLYKGNLHCHSNLSDGKFSPEELKRSYKKKGYSILAITDHENLINHSDLDDKDFLTITSSELAIKEDPTVSTGKNRMMKTCHINIYAKEQSNDYNPCYSSVYDVYSKKKNLTINVPETEITREYTPDSINSLIKTANDNGFFVSYNHPVWSLENYAQYSKYEGVWGVEIFNSECYRNGRFEYNINVANDFLRDGKRVFVTSGDDNHSLQAQFGTFVMVNSDELKYDSVIDSLLKGDFYSSTGPEIFEISIEENKVFVKSSRAAEINITTLGRRSASVKAKGFRGVKNAEFELMPDDGFFRITVVNKFGKRADSQSYFLDDIR